ncbi:MAG: hypothetical protein WCO94_05700 [Verrucomicrobiota bacterium]
MDRSLRPDPRGDALLADEQLDMPIGMSFVHENAQSGWSRTNPSGKIHHPSMHACWPVMGRLAQH